MLFNEPFDMTPKANHSVQSPTLKMTKPLDPMPPSSPADSHAHVCNICSKQFKRTEHLKRHMRSHEPGPYLQCDVCDRSFLRSDSLRRHKKIHKRAKEEECAETVVVSDTASKPSRPRLFNRACRQCAKARVRCDGAWPCERCTVSEISCERVKKKRSTGSDQDLQDCAASSTSDNISERFSRMEDSTSGESVSDNASQADLDGISVSCSTPKDSEGWQPVGIAQPSPANCRETSWPMSEYDLTWWPQTDPMSKTANCNILPMQQDAYFHPEQDSPIYDDSQWMEPNAIDAVFAGDCWSADLRVPKMEAAHNLGLYNTMNDLSTQPPWFTTPIVTFHPIYE